MERSVGKLETKEEKSTILSDTTGYPVAQVWPDTRLSSEDSLAIMAANADHLVECWNAFEDGGLVGELEEALEAWMKVESESKPNHPCPDYTLRAVYRQEAVKLTKAVLARAAEGAG